MIFTRIIRSASFDPVPLLSHPVDVFVFFFSFRHPINEVELSYTTSNFTVTLYLINANSSSRGEHMSMFHDRATLLSMDPIC